MMYVHLLTAVGLLDICIFSLTEIVKIESEFLQFKSDY